MNPLVAALRRNRQLLVLLFLTLMLWTVAAVLIQGFASGASLRNLLQQVAALAIVAAGQTVVIISGGIDLSIPSMMAVSAILTTYLTGGQDAALIWVVPTVFAVAAGVGIANGIGVGLLKVHPIIMTIATNVILSGAIVLATGTIPPAAPPPAIRELGQGTLGGIPLAFFLLLATTVVTAGLLSFTTFGRRVYAVGANETVSRFAGVRPAMVLIGAYAVSSLAAALGGLFLVGYVGVAFLGMGDKFLFSSVAAVVVGGASILGGSGSYLGTLVGVVLLTLINILMIVLNMSAGAISIFYGVTILASVWIGSLRSGASR